MTAQVITFKRQEPKPTADEIADAMAKLSMAARGKPLAAIRAATTILDSMRPGS